MSVELLEHRTAESRLAGANFAGELHETFPLPDPVEQMIECLAMLGAIKKKARVRRDVERRLAQAIVLQVHPASVAKAMPQEKKRFENCKAPKTAARGHFGSICLHDCQGLAFGAGCEILTIPGRGRSAECQRRSDRLTPANRHCQRLKAGGSNRCLRANSCIPAGKPA